ncbi:hypothetical protein [Bacillus atrophaeus]|nr:hypothetical protein [Bacillus atrophaeus]MED1122816.1 hypothetical protein [Bacillus atrophaeus]MED4809522.1 hypothetical protein [Bacillus atrophaeus]GED03055.1 hypothetical protein BAT02nite_26990 [Bacillus atrophaeus]
MKLDPIELNKEAKDRAQEITEEQKLKEQVMDLQRVCNLLMANQS